MEKLISTKIQPINYYNIKEFIKESYLSIYLFNAMVNFLGVTPYFFLKAEIK